MAPKRWKEKNRRQEEREKDGEKPVCVRDRERPWENWGPSVQAISIPQAWFSRSDHTLLLPEGSSIAACGSGVSQGATRTPALPVSVPIVYLQPWVLFPMEMAQAHSPAIHSVPSQSSDVTQNLVATLGGC